jgi:hypothetical protein
MHRSPTRLLITLLILSLVVTQFGCMTKPPSLVLHDKLINQSIALVPDRSDIEISLDVFSKSKPQGALKGAGQGIAGMLEGIRFGHCSGEFCGAALLLYLAFAVVVGGTVGAIQGVINATATDTAAEIEALIEKRLAEFSSHINLSQKVFNRSQQVPGLTLDLVTFGGKKPAVTAEEFLHLKSQGYQMVLTIRIEKLGFVGEKGEDPKLDLYLGALTSVHDVDSKEEEYHREFRGRGKTRRYSEWLKVDPDVLASELNDCLDKLTEDIVNSLFLAYNLPINSGSWTFPGTEGYGCCWICPVSPPLEIDYFPILKQVCPEVASRQPQLAWQPFPDEDRQTQFRDKTGHRATNVSYDLRVWETVGDQKGNLVYERYTLTASAHQVEDQLKSHKTYMWSVRACFDLDERAACTPWAFSLVPAGPEACNSTLVEPASYYRFRTP